MRLELVDRGLALLDVVDATGICARKLAGFFEARLLQPELGGERIDLRLERRRIDPEQHVARPDWGVGAHRHVGDLARHAGTMATELRSTTAEPCGAPQPIGMNRPNSSSTSTIAGDIFQKPFHGTNLNFTRTKRTR